MGDMGAIYGFSKPLPTPVANLESGKFTISAIEPHDVTRTANRRRRNRYCLAEWNEGPRHSTFGEPR